jgi:hypothetical protein
MNERICASSQFHDLIDCRFKVLPRLLYVTGSSHGGEKEGHFLSEKFEIYFEPKEPSI